MPVERRAHGVMPMTINVEVITRTGADAVLYRRDDGLPGIIEPPGARPPPFDRGPVRDASRYSEPVAPQTALEEMAELNHRLPTTTPSRTTGCRSS